MLKFNKNVTTSIDLINLLTDQPTTIQELADRLDISRYYTQGFVRQLVFAGLVKSSKGPNGGISKSDQGITLRDVLRVFSKEPQILNLQTPSGFINLEYLNFLDNTSVYRRPVATETYEPKEDVKNGLLDEDTTEGGLDLSIGW